VIRKIPLKITKVIGKLKQIDNIDIIDKKNDLKWIPMYIKTNSIDPKAHKKSLLAVFSIYKSEIASE